LVRVLRYARRGAQGRRRRSGEAIAKLEPIDRTLREHAILTTGQYGVYGCVADQIRLLIKVARNEIEQAKREPEQETDVETEQTPAEDPALIDSDELRRLVKTANMHSLTDIAKKAKSRSTRSAPRSTHGPCPPAATTPWPSS
jgi:hypothetical protein